MSMTTTGSRLSIWQAAFVIARRDFVAILFSRAFIFFLLGPLFPVIVGGLAGSIGGEVQRDAVSVEVGLAMSPADNAAMLAAGVEFLEAPRKEPYATVAVFRDLYGNTWDLLELA